MSDSDLPEDRRVNRREAVHLVAEIEANGEMIGCGVSRDASGGGFRLLTNLELEPNTAISLRLFVPREEEPRRLEATVVRSERAAPRADLVWRYQVAIALRDPSPELQELVVRLMRESNRPPAA